METQQTSDHRLERRDLREAAEMLWEEAGPLSGRWREGAEKDLEGQRKLADVAGGRCQVSRARGMPGPGPGLLRGVLERSQMSHFSPGIPFIRASMRRGPRKPE